MTKSTNLNRKFRFVNSAAILVQYVCLFCSIGDHWEGLVDWKLLATVFATVFIAELGDKTQLATLLFAADKEVSKWLVFVGASLALIATSAIGVAAGSLMAEALSPKLLSLVAGIGFIVIGAWTLSRAW